MLGLDVGGEEQIWEAQGLAPAQGLVSWERRSRHPPSFLLPPWAPLLCQLLLCPAHLSGQQPS